MQELFYITTVILIFSFALDRPHYLFDYGYYGRSESRFFLVNS
jgi:hypothetical protein